MKPRPKSTMKVPFDRRFSAIVTDFSATLYSREFFPPYESTWDVEPRPKGKMKVSSDCRFSSIVADFSGVDILRLTQDRALCVIDTKEMKAPCCLSHIDHCHKSIFEL